MYQYSFHGFEADRDFISRPKYCFKLICEWYFVIKTGTKGYSMSKFQEVQDFMEYRNYQKIEQNLHSDFWGLEKKVS